MLILSQILSGCAKENFNTTYSYNLPDFPVPNKDFADDLEHACSGNPDHCANINNYINKLYKFKTVYTIYKESIKYQRTK
jgi:hypothetical protein